MYIDGSQGEGGGQVLRSALALSAIWGEDLTIENIRANREKAGLRPQHLTGVLAMSELCGAEVEGAEKGSSTLKFRPNYLPVGGHTVDIGTAGSTALLLHVLCYPFFMGESGGKLRLLGGTHASMAPTFDYLDGVWKPMIALAGFEVELELIRHGFFPRGGGEIIASMKRISRETKAAVMPLQWRARPALDKIEVRATFGQGSVEKKRRGSSKNKGQKNKARLAKTDIPERMASAVTRAFAEYEVEVSHKCIHTTTFSSGATCTVIGHFGPFRAGFTAWGRRGLPAEKVGALAAKGLQGFISTPACFDPWMADQILLPLALSGRTASFTSSKMTDHLRTNAAVIKGFMPELAIDFETIAPDEYLISLKPKGIRKNKNTD